MIISTKLHIPRPGTAVVGRGRLVRKLNEGRHHALTLITAPAGYGKSTLLGEWASALGDPVAWISLDRGDNDRIRFWSHTLAALKLAHPAFDEQTIFRLSRGDASGLSFVAALINGLHRLPGPVVIIWDDFHVVDDGGILGDVTYLLEHLPPHVHLYIASRGLPELPLARMRTRGRLLQLEAGDLRFSPEEAADLFHASLALPLSDREKADVLERTEGWAAGLRLAALMLADEPDRGGVIRRISGMQKDYADYFMEEILSEQSEKVQLFLLSTSILNRMNAGLCNAVSGMDDGLALLQQLEQANVFLVSLDDRREWYRYHHLFGQFLRSQLQLRHPGLEQKLHAAAGKWLEENGLAFEAMEHYLAGALFDEATRLLEKLAPQMMRTNWGALRAWFSSIPDALLFGKPMLFMMKMASLFLSGELEQAGQSLARAKEKLDESAPLLPERAAGAIRAGISVLEAFRAFFAKDFASAVRYSEQYVRLHPDGDLFVGLGTDEDGYQPLWDIYAAAGGLNEAETVIRELLRVWSGTKNVFFVAHLHMSDGRCRYEGNRLSEAEAAFRRACELGERHNHQALMVMGSLWLAKICAAEGRRDEAEAIVKSRLKQLDRGQYPQLYGRIRLFEAVMERMQDGPGGEVAARWLETCGLKEGDEIPFSMMEEYDLFACLLAEQGKIPEAVRINDRLRYMADVSGRHHDRLRFTVHRCLIEAARPDNAMAAFDILEEALAMAHPEGYVRTFVDSGEPLARLLEQYIALRSGQHLPPGRKAPLAYARKLLRLIRQSVPTAGDGEGAFPIKPVLTGKEQLVLQLMDKGMTNREIAEHLDVALSTVKTHINHLYGKLHANSRLQALVHARELGLL